MKPLLFIKMSGSQVFCFPFKCCNTKTKGSSEKEVLKITTVVRSRRSVGFLSFSDIFLDKTSRETTFPNSKEFRKLSVLH